MFQSKQDVDRHVNEVFKNIKSEYQRNSKCYQIAKQYYKIKDFKSAIKYLNRYILTTTNSAAAHRLLGECYLGVNLKLKALDSFKTSLELNGSQNDLVLKICALLMDPDVSAVTPRAKYWLERAETLFPTNPVVFQLREHLLKSNFDGKQDNGQLEKLILSEISARPTDVTVRIRLLNFFVDTKRFKIAYQHALEIEDRNSFSSDPRWYDCLCNVVQAYEKSTQGLEFQFFIKKIIFYEKRADLSMQEFQEDVKTLPECSAALFAFDQSLHTVSKIEVPQDETYFFTEFMKHMRAQLSFHLATLALKRAKKEYGIWPKAFRTASPLLLQATQNSMDLEGAWYNMWPERAKFQKEVKHLNKSATFRVSQAGHVLLSWSESKGAQFLEKVSQFCGGKWQTQVYQDVFCSRDHQQATATSHFINDSFFSTVPMRLLTDSELRHFDEVAQTTYPDSLHHLVWLGLAYCNANGSLSNDFRCTIVPDLRFTVSNLSQTGPETLNQLDVDAFLYASVICAKSGIPNIVSSDKPSRLPVSISEELCSPAQADWWVSVYKTYTNQISDNIADTRLKLRKGIEVIRVFGQHGLHVKVIVMLAKLFQERANKSKNSNEVNGLEDRAYLYWSAAIPLLEKMEKNQQIREVPNRLFYYRGKDLSSSEIKGYLEDGRLFLGCRLMNQKRYEEAIDAFQSLKNPYATFYQAMIYEKLASEEVNHRPESITSENRSQHIILLTRARDALYLTLDRLRSPSVDPSHPLNSQLQERLDKIEKQLNMIDPSSTLTRNGDSQSDETDTAPGPLSPDADENLESSFNLFNSSNFLKMKNHSASKPSKNNLSEKNSYARFEARPSPERLDAQLRHLVHANSHGLQAIVEQLKEMKSTMQIELKDLGCVTRDLLAEMKRWNDRLESMSKRANDGLKPEDLFELREEDYDDIEPLTQSYTPYQNYPLNRQMTGTQGTSTVTYGTPVPSPIPPVQPVIPGAEVLIPPAFYPNAHGVHGIDPALLYQSLGYYAPGMPYGENPSAVDYRGTGIQKGAPFAKPAYKMPEVVPTTTTTATSKAQPPNVVITSSDTLPAFTSTGTPAMSVTVPPQHIRGLAPSFVTPKANLNQVHPFQIQMPPQAQLVRESPTEKLNSLAPTTLSPSVQAGLVSGVKPTPIEQTSPLKDSSLNKSGAQINATPVKNSSTVQTPEENKLFESRGRLSVFEQQWKDKGVVIVKILHDEKQGKVRILLLQEPSFIVFSNHCITPEMNIEVVPDKKFCWGWTGNSGLPAGQKVRIQFNSDDESKDFEFAINEGRRRTKQKSVPKTPEKNCVSCKTKMEGNGDKCGACENKDKAKDKANLGGFTFSSSPIVKPPTLKVSEPKVEVKEAPKPSPFAAFSFSTPTTKPSKVDTQPKTTTPSLFDSSNVTSTAGSPNLFAGLKADPNAFKKDANFKAFEGQGSLVFGSQKPASTKPDKTKTPKNEDDDDGEDEFVPTAEFKPVVDLPDLVDVKTGEENDEVLYDERAKLLRFDTSLKEWKERGIGQMRLLLNPESGKVRLIMRREQVLKVCCNHYLDDQIEFKRMTKSDRALTWCAQDYSEGETKSELFALKFSKPESMVRFEQAVENARLKMKNFKSDGAKPKASEEKPKELKPLSELFKPKAGSWECATCFVRNEESAVKCISCETPKPGTETATKESPTQSTGLGKGITFPPTTTKFLFGIPPTTCAPTTKSFPVFGVSTTTAPSPSPSMPKFSFGIPSTTTTTAASSLSTPNIFKNTTNLFSQASTATTTPSSTTTSKFTFQKTPATTDTSNKNIFGGFGSSNSTSTTTPSFSFGIPKTTSAPVSTAESLFSLGTGVSTTTATSTATKFSFSIPNTAPKTGTTNLFEVKTSPFGVPKTEDVAKSTSTTAPSFSFSSAPGKEKFEFSISNIKPISTIERSPRKKSGGDATASEGSDGEPEEDDSGDHIIVKPIVPLPDKVDIHTGEEDEDVLYEQRAKLFRYTDKEWKERGIGNIRVLKHKTTNKIRLLMRRDAVLKVCLNHYLTPEIEFTAKDEKSWTWSAADYSEGEVRYDMFAIRFKNGEFAQAFKKAVDDIRNNRVPSLAQGDASVKAKEPSAAMKNFTFATPSSQGMVDAKKLGSGGSDDDIEVVYENKVTPEQREKAMRLHLPPNFYAYLQAPDCPGCLGCDKEDSPAPSEMKTPETKPKSVFEGKSWGSLNFGGENGSEKKVVFSFAGNQGTPIWNFGNTGLKPSENAKNLEEEDEDEEEDDDDDDDEDDDDDDYEDEGEIAEEEDLQEEEEGDEDEDEDEDD